MIFFKPTEIKSGECTALFEAFMNEDKLGECRLILKESGADVYMLEYDKACPEIGEGLLKSAYNYAANHGAYIGILSAKDDGKAHLLLNFEIQGDVYKNDIPSLLAGHCHCGNKI